MSARSKACSIVIVQMLPSPSRSRCPVAVSVHEGNVADSLTLMPAVTRLRERFGIGQLVMVAIGA